jgi:hypothetical protein
MSGRRSSNLDFPIASQLIFSYYLRWVSMPSVRKLSQKGAYPDPWLGFRKPPLAAGFHFVNRFFLQSDNREGFMSEKFWIYFPVILTCGILFFMLSVLKVLRRRIRLKSLRPSFKENLLRIPGGSLLRALDNLDEQIHLYLVYVIILPLILYATLISYFYYRAEQPPLSVIWISAIIGSLVFAYLIFNLAKLSSRRKRIRLGYEGELAVGQELNHLMGQGI